MSKENTKNTTSSTTPAASSNATSTPNSMWVTVNNSTSASAQRTAIEKGNDFTHLIKSR